MKKHALHLLKSNHQNLLNRLAAGFASALCVIASTTASADTGKVVGVTADNYAWGTTGTLVTFDPDAAGPNVTCNMYGGSSYSAGSNVGGGMALIAMLFPTKFNSVAVSCGTTYFEISLKQGTAQSYFYRTIAGSKETAWVFTNINGVNCFSNSAGQADKIALAMATDRPMTNTCVYNPYANENQLKVTF